MVHRSRSRMMDQKTKNFTAPIFNPFFLGSFTVYSYLLISVKYNFFLPALFQAHLADLLCLPILLSLSLSVLRIISKKEHLQLSKLKVFAAFLYVSFLFEVFLPYFSIRYTADLIDVIAYGAGGFAYYYSANNINN